MKYSTETADKRPPLRSNGKEFVPLDLKWNDYLKKK